VLPSEEDAANDDDDENIGAEAPPTDDIGAEAPPTEAGLDAEPELRND